MIDLLYAQAFGLVVTPMENELGFPGENGHQSDCKRFKYLSQYSEAVWEPIFILQRRVDGWGNALLGSEKYTSIDLVDRLLSGVCWSISSVGTLACLDYPSLYK